MRVMYPEEIQENCIFCNAECTNTRWYNIVQEQWFSKDPQCDNCKLVDVVENTLAGIYDQTPHE